MNGWSHNARSVRMRAELRYSYGITLTKKVPTAADFEAKAKQYDAVGATQSAAIVRRLATYL